MQTQQDKQENITQKVLTLQQSRAIDTLMPQIAMSWRESLENGLAPTLAKLPELDKKLAKECYEKKYSVRRYNSISYIRSYVKSLKNIGAVLLSIDESGLIFNVRGDENLISKLKEINICVGGWISEEKAGVTGSSRAFKERSGQYVVGEEHYLEILSDYATIGELIKRREDWTPGTYMVIVPKANFHPTQLNQLSQLSELLKMAWLIDELALFRNYFKNYYKKNRSAYVLVDINGDVFEVGSELVQLGLCPKKPNFQPLTKLLPELSSALDCLKSGNPIADMEVVFHRQGENPVSFYMNCQTLEGKGVLITLEAKLHVKRKVVQVANFSAHYTENDIIGSSQALGKAKHLLQLAARNQSTVLITGESGTGKEMFAQAIHNSSVRKNNAFISINCAAIPKELINSELFGYEPGAFTGANKNGSLGKIELADGGTLFLDEISEMPLDMQAVLLRVLEERYVQRLGAKYPIPVDIRIIAATNQNIREAVDRSQFRLDLYYRLNVIHINVPSLRNRKEDIRMLSEFFLKNSSEMLEKNINSFHSETLKILEDYTWPGNIRELRNVIEASCIICSSSQIAPEDLPQELSGQPKPDIKRVEREQKKEVYSQRLLAHEGASLFETLENQKIIELMDQHNGNKTKVAQALNITRATLYKRLRRIEDDYS